MSVEIQPSERDCAICLQKCHYPTRLPCGHVFCFLCMKGVALRKKNCAMCRAHIPSDYLQNPVLLEPLPVATETNGENDFQWYYEGRNGWWKYDARSNQALEAEYASGESVCSLLLAGTIYMIDFSSMVQIRRNDTSKRRAICRESSTFPAKGVAGIRNNTPVASATVDTAPVLPENVQATTNPAVLQNREELSGSTISIRLIGLNERSNHWIEREEGSVVSSDDDDTDDDDTDEDDTDDNEDDTDEDFNGHGIDNGVVDDALESVIVAVGSMDVRGEDAPGILRETGELP